MGFGVIAEARLLYTILRTEENPIVARIVNRAGTGESELCSITVNLWRNHC